MVTNAKMRVGDLFTCLYPKHGRRNILVRQTGRIEATGISCNGPYITIQRETTGYRTLQLDKMVSARVVIDAFDPQGLQCNAKRQQ